MHNLLVALLAFAAIFLLEALFYSVRYLSERRTEELKRRLQSLGTVHQGSFALLRQGKLSAVPALDALLRVLPFTQRLEPLLEQAAMEITVARLLTYCALAAGGAAIAGALLGGTNLALFLGAVAGAVPTLMVLVARERRNAKLSEQLPEALDMMARSLRAGHSLASAFKMVATELPAPISVEFGRAFEEQNLGMPFERAVIQMTKRAPNNRELKIFAVSVILQKETGGNLVEIIEKIADTIRARYKFQGKLAGLTAEGRMSSYIVGALPFVTLLFLLFANRPYIWPLLTTDMGHYFLGGALVLWLLGFAWMKQMTKVTI